VRVGAIDTGTNSTRLLVADVRDGTLEEVARRLRITRLGEGVDKHAMLSEKAIERVLTVIREYVEEARRLGATRMLATATSAVRDSANGAAFLDRIESEAGVETRRLTGREEAEMTFRGVTSDRTVTRGTLIVDIGGGSTELILGGPDGVARAESLQLGCVRLTERHLLADPPAEAELRACADDVRSRLPHFADVSAGIGVAGTITTLAALDLNLAAYDPTRSHGHRLTRDAVERQFGRLRSVRLAEREQMLHLEPARAGVIVAGVVVLREAMDAYGLREIEVSERDILHGAALAAAETAQDAPVASD
jgi:exopolyphosphatase/guanosine-5'-triphosphate,3'-diphosphate pyrophosphatase